MKLSIGQQIRFYRDAKDITQTTLAAEIGMSRDHISQIERGLSLPSQKTLDLICNKLDLEQKLVLTKNPCVKKKSSN